MTVDPVRRIGVLISGRGSNLQALIDAVSDGRLDATIAIVISNRDDAEGLNRARRAGIDALCVSHEASPSREDHERELVRALKARYVGLVCLAGYMRRLGPTMVDAFPNAILNIHPSLLPSFPGLDAQRRAFEYGVKVTGVTVHLVTLELDAGPIVLQRAVDVLDSDTPTTLAARILETEHIIYPEAVKLVLDKAWSLDGRRVLRSPRGDAT